MSMTFYIRLTDEHYPEPCINAWIPLADPAAPTVVTAYLGRVDGKYKPTHVITYTTTRDETDYTAWMLGKGYIRADEGPL
jgi:hypothetical protein